MSFRCLFYDGKGNAFFWNTKLFCHFLLADIEKVLYIYMPFYDGMGTYNKVETAAQKKMFHGADYVFMADMWTPKHLTADTCGYLFLGKMVLRC